jgi:hypothetical protein
MTDIFSRSHPIFDVDQYAFSDGCCVAGQVTVCASHDAGGGANTGEASAWRDELCDKLRLRYLILEQCQEFLVLWERIKMADTKSVWVKFDDLSSDIRDEAWSLYQGEAKSDSEYFGRLLRNPLPILMEELEGVESDWHVITNLINHHVSFEGDAVARTAMVMPEEKTVVLTFYKHRPNT